MISPGLAGGNGAPGTSRALSGEVFLVEFGKRCLVYAPLARLAFMASVPAAELHQSLAAGPLRRLVESKAIRRVRSRLRTAAGRTAAPPEPAASGPFQPTAVTLFLTNDCNLRCRYCYASAGDSDPVTMPFDLARAAVELVIANATAAGAPAIELSFHGGGEPTVAWDLLVATCQLATDLARTRGLGVKAMLATNGVLSDQKTDWIVRNLTGASVSFDGRPEFQDANRPLRSGRGSCEQILRTIAAMDRAQFNYGLRLTVAGDHTAGMADSVRFICERFHPISIMLEPAFGQGRWREAGAVDARGFVEGFRSARRIAREHGQDVCFSAARFPAIVNRFCGISQDNFCVTPGGEVTACFMAMDATDLRARRFIYGRYDVDQRSFNFDQGTLNGLRGLRPAESQLCRGCFAKWHCGGDCLFQSLAINAPAGGAGVDRCAITRDLTRDALMEQIGQSADETWMG